MTYLQGQNLGVIQMLVQGSNSCTQQLLLKPCLGVVPFYVSQKHINIPQCWQRRRPLHLSHGDTDLLLYRTVLWAKQLPSLGVHLFLFAHHHPSQACWLLTFPHRRRQEGHKTLIWVSSHSISPTAYNSTQIAHCSGERQEYIGQGELACVGLSTAMKTPLPAG